MYTYPQGYWPRMTQESIYGIFQFKTMLISGERIQGDMRPKSLRIGIHLWGLGVFLFFGGSL